jgi:hypothetical protein
MKMNKIKVISEKSNFVIKDGVIFANPSGATPAIAMDNRMYVSYDLGIKLIIPTGVVALLLPPNNASRFSVSQTGNFVLLPGVHENVSIEYKVNTDAIPRVFEKDEQCAQIVFVSTEQMQFETEISVKEPAAPAVDAESHNIQGGIQSGNSAQPDNVNNDESEDEQMPQSA